MRKSLISFYFVFLLSVLLGSSTADTVITSDTSLSGSVTDLPVVIAANNITLDCNGNVLDGDGTEPGVVIQNHTGVIVTECFVFNVADGFDIDSSRNLVLSQNIVGSASGDAFDLNQVQFSSIIENEVGPNGAGFRLNKSHSNSFIGNGIELSGEEGFRMLMSAGAG
ncbi:right-handed parallel beta-helix repeat-containing protein [bacterium]|nr:right-handed parallel beta-helix repeat-containing protein [bacterium]MCI0607359.1 right-handed parallel beta-helix repeat-containing protein [bacterium]